MAKLKKAPYIIIAVIIVVIIMISVALRLSIDNMQRQVAYLNDSLVVVQNLEIKLMAEYQELANRDTIVYRGITEHGLIFSSGYTDSVTVKNDKIENLRKIFAN